MPRVKRGNKRKEYRKKILKRASGYFLTKSKLYQAAEEAVERGLKFAYRGRREKKRQFRALWIVRINAAAQLNGLSYSQLIHGLKINGVELDRKVLADIAVNDPQGFAALALGAKDAFTKKKSEADKVNAANHPKRASKDSSAHNASSTRTAKAPAA